MLRGSVVDPRSITGALWRRPSSKAWFVSAHARVILDTRGIHASKSLVHAETRARKPNLPVIMRATASHPFVRCVPHEDFAQSHAIAEAWATQVAGWLAERKTPYVFLHAPDDTFAPDNAYAFHALLRARAEVGDLPAWPGQPRQLGLF